MWQGGWMTRDKAYEWLAETLEITKDECHIGMFDESMCKRVIETCGGKLV
jgi:hypothetical protein